MNSYDNGNRLRLNSIWHNMKTRCTNPNYDKYQYYGGRGIKVCDEWMNSYTEFAKWAMLNGYNDNLTLERIDINGDYTPDNCRWATWKEQANNRTTNTFLTHNGKTQTVQQWSEETGLTHSCIEQRIKAGWPTERILTEPTNQTHIEHWITFNGKTQRLYEWANELGIKYKVLHNRINLRHWPVERALTEPVVRRQSW